MRLSRGRRRLSALFRLLAVSVNISWLQLAVASKALWSGDVGLHHRLLCSSRHRSSEIFNTSSGLQIPTRMLQIPTAIGPARQLCTSWYHTYTTSAHSALYVFPFVFTVSKQTPVWCHLMAHPDTSSRPDPTLTPFSRPGFDPMADVRLCFPMGHGAPYREVCSASPTTPPRVHHTIFIDADHVWRASLGLV